MRFFLITGAVVLTLGVGSTVALGGYDTAWRLADLDVLEHRHDARSERDWARRSLHVRKDEDRRK